MKKNEAKYNHDSLTWKARKDELIISVLFWDYILLNDLHFNGFEV